MLMTISNEDLDKKMDRLHKETMKVVDSIKIQVDVLEDNYNIHVAVGKALTKQKNKGDLSMAQKLGVLFSVTSIILVITGLFFSQW